MACIWWGVQAWLGGQCVYIFIRCIFPSFARIPNTMPASSETTTGEWQTSSMAYAHILTIQPTSFHSSSTGSSPCRQSGYPSTNSSGSSWPKRSLAPPSVSLFSDGQCPALAVPDPSSPLQVHWPDRPSRGRCSCQSRHASTTCSHSSPTRPISLRAPGRLLRLFGLNSSPCPSGSSSPVFSVLELRPPVLRNLERRFGVSWKTWKPCWTLTRPAPPVLDSLSSLSVSSGFSCSCE